MSLRGRTYLVTGGSGGIGLALVQRLAQEGAGVAVQYRDNKKGAGQAVASVQNAGGRGVAIQADLSQRDEAHRLVEEAVKAIGPLHGAALLAGYPFRREVWFSNFEELESEDLKGPLNVDLLGSLFVAQALCPRLAERGEGSVVFTASTPALTGDTAGVPYLLAKAGLIGLMKSLARLYGPRGVRVNAVAFGSIKTEAMGDLSPGEEAPLVAETALKRFGTPDEAAAAVAFLLSDAAAYITGETLVVDGGTVCR